jgi:pyruvate/2-oxoglutarate dehydrogenase complex dihydrolipoamide dehydrogenase (E3) component
MLVPLEDPDIAEVLERSFRKRGIQIMTGSKVETVEVSDHQVRVMWHRPKVCRSCRRPALAAAGRRTRKR